MKGSDNRRVIYHNRQSRSRILPVDSIWATNSSAYPVGLAASQVSFARCTTTNFFWSVTEAMRLKSNSSVATGTFAAHLEKPAPSKRVSSSFITGLVGQRSEGERAGTVLFAASVCSAAWLGGSRARISHLPTELLGFDMHRR